jgi:hypothetical protein
MMPPSDKTIHARLTVTILFIDYLLESAGHAGRL